MADSARSKNDAIMLKAIRELDAHTAELRERRSDPAAVSDAVNGHIDSALEALVAPLNSRRYPFLLEADDQAEYRDTAMTTDPPSPDEDDEDEEDDDDEDDDDEDDDDEDDEELTGSNHAEYVFMVGKTAIYAWEYLGKEWSEWIVRLDPTRTGGFR